MLTQTTAYVSRDLCLKCSVKVIWSLWAYDIGIEINELPLDKKALFRVIIKVRINIPKKALRIDMINDVNTIWTLLFIHHYSHQESTDLTWFIVLISNNRISENIHQTVKVILIYGINCDLFQKYQPSQLHILIWYGKTLFSIHKVTARM